MTVAWTIGAGSLIFGQLNLVSCAFAAVLVGLGVDYAIHIYNRYVEERARGLGVEEAFAMSLSHTGWGVFIGMATTSLAFIALKATRFTQLSEFGILAGIGIFFSVPSMLFVLPALITWRSRTREEHARAMRPTSFFLPQIADFVATHRRLVLVVGILLALGSAILLAVRPKNYTLAFDKRTSSLRPEDRAFELGGEIAKAFSNRNPNKLMLLAYGETEEQALEQAAELETGCVALTRQTYNGEPMLRAYKSVMKYLPAPSRQKKRLEILSKIDFTAALKAFRAALDRENLLEADFHFCISLLEQHAKLIQEKRIIKPSDYRNTPLWRHIRRMVTRRRQALDLRDPLPAGLSFPVELAKPAMSRKDEVKAPAGAMLSKEELLALQHSSQLAKEDRVKRVTLFDKGWTIKTSVYPPVLSDSKSADLKIDNEWIRRTKQTLGLKDDVKPARNDAFLTGMGLLAHALAAVVKEDFWNVSFAVFGVAIVVLTVFFHRHPIRVLYSLLPIVFGLLYLFGFMCITSIPFNFVNVLAVPIIIGLGVDNGIHLVERFYESRRQIRPMIADTGRAIMITSLTSIIGFGSLAVGGYRGITSMGILSILALTANLIVSLLVFPAVLATFSPPEEAPVNPEDDED